MTNDIKPIPEAIIFALIPIVLLVAVYATPGLYFCYLTFRDPFKGNYKSLIINLGKFFAIVVVGGSILYFWPYK